ncbi:amp dependent CoA ligase [Mycena rebaudengoi]|nr:amp dependent CoA ligase [Mycena rebaudengoi]
MSEFYSPLEHHVPDDLSLAQFMLDYQHPLQPIRGGAAFIVLICSPNNVDYPVALWATQRLGGIFTGANPASTPDELVHQIKITETTLIIAHSSTFELSAKAARLAGLVDNRVIILDHDPSSTIPSVPTLILEGLAAGGPSFVERKLGPGDGQQNVCALCMSSGTTGPPKAVAISHAAIIANLIQLTVLNNNGEKATRPEDVTFNPGDATIAVLPFFHIAGLVFNPFGLKHSASLHFMMFYGASLVVIQKFDFIAMLESITRHKIRHLMQVIILSTRLHLLKTSLQHPAAAKYDFSHIKFVGAGAAPMTAELQEQLKQVCTQAKTGQAYGLTETAAILTVTPFAQQCSYGSIGLLLPGVRARVVKADGSLAGYNEPGELVVKTPSLFLGYWKNEEASKEAFTADGWFRTGDEVKVAENGEVWITDRIKELIKVKGFQVSPAELEGAILNHPDVSDVCVVGVPNETSGEAPMAFVVLTESAMKRAKVDPELVKASIKKYVADNKAHYKQLKGGVEFIPLIPKSASGKILRRFLRDTVKVKL